MSFRSHKHIQFKTQEALGGVDEQIKKFRSRMFLIHVEEAKEWMERMIKETITIPNDGDTDFLDVLRTSEHLAMLGNRFRKKKHRVFRNINPNDRMAFRKSMDNFQNFQAACIECGFPKFMLCSFEDLYKRKNITSVVQTIHAFAHHLVRNGYITDEEGMKDFEERKDDFEFSEQAINKIEKDFKKIEQEKGKLNLDFSAHKKKRETGPPKRRNKPAPLPPMNPSLIFYSGSNRGVMGEKGSLKLTLPLPSTQNFDVNFECFLRNKRNPLETIVLKDIVKEKENKKNPNQTCYVINYQVPSHGEFEVLTTINKKYKLPPFSLTLFPHGIDPQSIRLRPLTNIDWNHLERGKQYRFRLKMKDVYGNEYQPKSSNNIPFDLNFTSLGEKKNCNHQTNLKYVGNGEFEVLFKCPFDGKFELSLDHSRSKSRIFQKLCICDSTQREVEERVYLQFLEVDQNKEDEDELGSLMDNIQSLDEQLSFLGFKPDTNNNKKARRRRVECILKLKDIPMDDFFFSFDVRSDDDEKDGEFLKTQEVDQGKIEEMFRRYILDRFNELIRSDFEMGREREDKEDILRGILDDDRIMDEFGRRVFPSEKRFCRNDLFSPIGTGQDWEGMRLRVENFRIQRWKEEELERRQLEELRLIKEKELEEERQRLLKERELEEARRRKEEEEENWRYLRELQRKKKLEEEEKRRRAQVLIEEEKRRRMMEEQRKKWEEENPFFVPRPPPWDHLFTHPNQRGTSAHRKLYNLNFWVQLFLKVEKMKKQIKSPKKIDGQGEILQFSTKDILLTLHQKPEFYNCARKRDLLSLGDLLLTTAQNYLFSMINEIGESAPGLKANAVKVVKGVFPILKDVYDTYRFVLEKTPYFARDLPMEYTPIIFTESNKPLKSKLVDLLSSTVTEYVKILFGVVSTLGSIIHPSFRNNMKLLNPTMSSNMKFVHNMFLSFLYQTHSTTKQRKIMVSELNLLNPPQDTREGKPLLTKSHSVNIPMNVHFDDQQFLNTQVFGISTHDKHTMGLKNVYKTAYVRNYVEVKFECIRSNIVTYDEDDEVRELLKNSNLKCSKLTSLPQLSVQGFNNNKKMEIMISNTKSLLTLIAANHAKRFSRKELLNCTPQHPLEIPAIFLSLLTPFYFRSEIQNALIHQKLILSCLSSIRHVKCDIHDGGEALTVPVKYSGTPILLNFGVGVVIKTLQMGIGFQRMLNNRRNGIRPLEIEVMNYLWTMRQKRNQLRNQIFGILQQTLFNDTRTGKFFQSSLGQRKEKIDNINFLLSRYDSERVEKVKNLDAAIIQYQTKLETLISQHLEPNLKSVTKLEYYFRLGGIKNTVDKIMGTHKKIYLEVEKKYDDLWKDEIHWEGMLVSELNSVFIKFAHLQQHGPLNNLYYEYQDISTRMIDLTNLFMDFRTLYFEKRHESFSLNPLKKVKLKNVMVHDPYDLPVRLLLLGFGLGYSVHLSSLSGGERCNEAVDQMLEYTEMRVQFGKFPSILRDTQKFNNWRKKIHSTMAINGGSFDMNKVNNVGLPGSDRDPSVSGRFYKLEDFQRYIGLWDVFEDGLKLKKGKKQIKEGFEKYKKLRN